MKIEVLDTTLRDGEQTPGISLNAIKKLRIATKLDEIGVNAIEAGSAITSEGEREAIKLITSKLADAVEEGKTLRANNATSKKLESITAADAGVEVATV